MTLADILANVEHTHADVLRHVTGDALDWKYVVWCDLRFNIRIV